MTAEEIKKIADAQHEFFLTGKTLDPAFRVAALGKLHAAIKNNEGKLAAAISADLGKSAFEGYMCEMGMALSEISYMIKNTPRLAKRRRAKTPLAQFASSSYVEPSPYGSILIMSPWNYPLMLTIDPLADALAAGNVAIIKPSAYSPNVSSVIAELIAETFEPEYVTVITGGRAENTELLNQKFDYIFFTGSQAVGRDVMRHAADFLTPVTLELGGKSPCIVEKSANIKLAAKRIVFGKYLNCGQTCVAPDYIYCDAAMKDEFIAEVKKEIIAQYGDDPLKNPDYGKIINEKHFERILGLIYPERAKAALENGSSKTGPGLENGSPGGDAAYTSREVCNGPQIKSGVVFGGASNPETLQIAPTVMDNVTWDDPVMGEEIFGPVMPILSFSSIDEVIAKLNTLQKPLALYMFSADKAAVRKVTSRVRFGGGCINDTIIHLATTEMPFGGVGESGMGGYHGKDGFNTFSHLKAIVDKKTWIDMPMRYHPYTALNDKLIRMFLK